MNGIIDLDKLAFYFYIPAALLFCLSIKGLGKHESAQWGNILGMVGTAFAVAATISIAYMEEASGGASWLIVIALVPSGVAGVVLAFMVPMTSMPEMVGLLNAFGGLAAALASFGTYHEAVDVPETWKWSTEPTLNVNTWYFALYVKQIVTYLGVFVGCVTFSGSVLAMLKLQGTIKKRFEYGGMHIVSILTFILVGVFLVLFLAFQGPDTIQIGAGFLALGAAVSLFMGIHSVGAIGGADMPVVISVLNSCSGWAGVLAGFASENSLLVIAGALVGASGAILSYIMCKAMNRSLMNVLIGGFGEKHGGGAASKSKGDGEALVAKEINVDELTDNLLDAKEVVIIPGYGMAVAQAQHAVSKVTDILRDQGVNVRFAIHPVAGRLPGHMNVLLAEAKVPYNVVYEMDKINPDLPETDVAIVMGANDIVNPAAEEDPDSDIAGMPVIRCWVAKKCVVMKRSLAAGYAGVENPLFFKEHSYMLFGDAKKNSDAMVTKLSEKAEKRGKKVQQNNGKSVNDTDDATAALALSHDSRAQSIEFPLPTRWVGVLKERFPASEKRVALVPSKVRELREAGIGVAVESGAGDGADFPDEMFEKEGATILKTPEAVCDKSEIVVKVNAPTFAPKAAEGAPAGSSETLYPPKDEIAMLREGQTLISFLNPRADKELSEKLAQKGVTSLGMDAVPRTTKAQEIDALSVFGNIAGYRAVVEAANVFGRFFTGQVTAAGRSEPAKVLVIGAGVAGLAAIGAARALGAEVRGFDVRKEVREQIESMGASFLTVDMEEDGGGAGGYAKEMSKSFLERELALFAAQAEEVDIIITTAAIPGKPAPKLLLKSTVELMRPGSVIVDLAAPTGGNCELTVKDEAVVHKFVHIIGYTDLTSRMSGISSQFYGTCVSRVILHMTKGTSTEILEKMTVTKGGEVVFAPPAPPPPKPAAAQKKKESADAAAEADALKKPKKERKPMNPTLAMLLNVAVTSIACVAVAFFVPFAWQEQVLVFVLACVLGYMLVWGVHPALHTPLMSFTNAISGIVLLAGLELLVRPNAAGKLGGGEGAAAQAVGFLGFFACVFASFNVAGGFAVTQRMLAMFVKKE
uniref:NAD(P) transhydrogenase, mitochondrial n=1 Tax=Chromera velia CCMP2878 TaxID=1169474 RepID=A0A0G4I966_9ALVE|eukprot:Cvel_12186.t1-p1 / transcript=Cvel_12186.t1 / gene=Cvel_12186 / organism=Chromera_velia_CCMP2878 / gene_product=NAD(P) transhydrogenase subunit beta, putative / transcript_product=NAD(P) transhydrogenase subunit beta, putative / location=Cvel_scaffold787:29249-39105(+) / protein_length=1090 / sequence_SO=supercontig / SO=protein_coding / is_pseudo=false